jgi:hypothetical protein
MIVLRLLGLATIGSQDDVKAAGLFGLLRELRGRLSQPGAQCG